MRRHLVSQIAVESQLILAVDSSLWLRPEAKTLKDRGFHHNSGQGIGVGHSYSTVAWIPEESRSWVLPLRHERITSFETVLTKTSFQLKQVCRQLKVRPLVVFDRHYRNGSFLKQTAEILADLLIRLASNRCVYGEPEAYSGRVAQAFPTIIAVIGTMANPPKTCGKSPGRKKGQFPHIVQAIEQKQILINSPLPFITAGMESNLDAIALGEKSWQPYLCQWNQNYLDPAIAKLAEGIAQAKLTIPKSIQTKANVTGTPTEYQCPICKKQLERYDYKKNGKEKSLLRCSDSGARKKSNHKHAVFFLTCHGNWWNEKIGQLNTHNIKDCDRSKRKTPPIRLKPRQNGLRSG